ncbi:MAG: polyprenyl synthetase family protein [Chloroflexota bacterium]
MTSLHQFNRQMQPAIDQTMQRVVLSHPLIGQYHGLKDILSYHLGWDVEGDRSEVQGKRIRPLLVLLSCAACNDHRWETALPAAAAVELLHNFSLIHDDIEDRSPLRRGRETVWKKWGEALAINAGDALFSLAFDAIYLLQEKCPEKIVLQSLQIMNTTCVQLTGGQHLDISYENERFICLEDYWKMIEGKTAALISASTRIGALIGGGSDRQQNDLAEFGRSLGIAFQIQDDWLGIWGDATQTGKSNESDLVSGKKSLPIVFALQQKGKFSRRWLAGPIQTDEVREVAQWLIEEGAQYYTEEQAEAYTRRALHSLADAKLDNNAGQALHELALRLLKRSS